MVVLVFAKERRKKEQRKKFITLYIIMNLLLKVRLEYILYLYGKFNLNKWIK